MLSIARISECGVWRSLNRMLKPALVVAGMTFTAGFPVSMVVKASVEGSKCSLPLSSVHEDSRAAKSAMIGIGLRPRAG
jgi:hypothetical protein